jgi:hypothetical protein
LALVSSLACIKKDSDSPPHISAGSTGQSVSKNQNFGQIIRKGCKKGPSDSMAEEVRFN